MTYSYSTISPFDQSYTTRRVVSGPSYGFSNMNGYFGPRVVTRAPYFPGFGSYRPCAPSPIFPVCRPSYSVGLHTPGEALVALVVGALALAALSI
jgi:hypothetical protein